MSVSPESLELRPVARPPEHLPVRCEWPDLESVAALQRLCTEFCWLVDHGQADQVAHLFCDDVRYEAQGTASAGIDALMLRMQARAARRDYTSRHVASSFRFHLLGDGDVSGHSTLIVFRDTVVPAVVADVHDRFRRIGDGTWRIAERRIVPMMAAQS